MNCGIRGLNIHLILFLISFILLEVEIDAKQCRESFHSSDNKSEAIFDLIHVDLWGPYRSSSLCNAFYFLMIVDDYSRGVWVYLLHDKAQVGKTLKNYITLISRQFDKKIKMVRSDNGTEFTCLTTEFCAQGIVHQTSYVGTPQRNGRVERKHRHILNVARALLFQASLAIKFWGETILAAAYLINRTPSTMLKRKTPYEILYGSVPPYDNLRVFGCLAFAHNQKRDGDKFCSRSRQCVFLGYPFDKKGWTLYDLDKDELFVSRDIVFVENTFPFQTKEEPGLSLSLLLDDALNEAVEELIEVPDIEQQTKIRDIVPNTIAEATEQDSRVDDLADSSVELASVLT
ncbi:Retrovirus-related Pol polyprotein from transposon TNT 1-94 [Cardamine amara subsp. amara]|uniref:Retrovirus-related Pol polyprotein from transposon TNT 1-94 n=1 Tax=Cardamine amara subsp. amara TaxID=228776 RepID=A0ABD1BZF9_CARAN